MGYNDTDENFYRAIAVTTTTDMKWEVAARLQRCRGQTIPLYRRNSYEPNDDVDIIQDRQTNDGAWLRVILTPIRLN